MTGRRRPYRLMIVVGGCGFLVGTGLVVAGVSMVSLPHSDAYSVAAALGSSLGPIFLVLGTVLGLVALRFFGVGVGESRRSPKRAGRDRMDRGQLVCAYCGVAKHLFLGGVSWPRPRCRECGEPTRLIRAFGHRADSLPDSAGPQGRSD